MNIDAINIAALNSATKYPSIPTYHTLGDKGRLAEPAIEFDGPVQITEKVDGTNARIVLLPDAQYLIGSREELLFCEGDRLHNPSMGIVDVLRSVFPRLGGLLGDNAPDGVWVIYQRGGVVRRPSGRW